MDERREIHARFWSKLAGLVAGGVPWVDAFSLAGASVPEDRALRGALERAVGSMRDGDAPSDALAASGRFSPEVVRLVRAAEEMGDLEVKANHIAAQVLGGAFDVEPEPATGAPWPPRLREIVERALDDGASHVHVEPGGRVRVRRDGVLEDREALAAEDLAAAMPALRSGSIAEIGGRALHVDRVEFLEGPAAVLRLPDEGPTTIHEPALTAARAWVAGGRGLVLLAGPPGSGRLDVLRAALEGTDVKVCLVVEDDPPDLPGALRLAARGDLDGALRTALRQDPDLVALPRLPDARTARRALAAASDRLVVARSSADRAAEALAGLSGLDIEAELLAARVRGVMAVRRLRGTGAGSVVIGEVLDVDEDARRALLERRPLEPDRSLREAALEVAAAGGTTREEALAVTPV